MRYKIIISVTPKVTEKVTEMINKRSALETVDPNRITPTLQTESDRNSEDNVCNNEENLSVVKGNVPNNEGNLSEINI